MGRFRYLSLSRKILAGSVGLVIFLTLALFLAVHLIVMPRLEGEIIRRGYTIARAVSVQAGGYVITRDEPKLLALIFEKPQLDRSISYLIVTDTEGHLLADTFIQPLPPGVVSAHRLPRSVPWDVRLIHFGGHSYYDTAHPITEGIYQVGTVRVGMSKALVDDVVAPLHLALFGVMGFLVVVSIWVSSRFARHITQPVAELTRAADEIARGNLDVELAGEEEPQEGSQEGSPEGRWRVPFGWGRGSEPVLDETEILTRSFAHMVHQLKQSRDELGRAYDFRDNLLRSSPDAVVATDETGIIVLFNEGAERLFDYRAGEVLGHLRADDLWCPAARALTLEGRLADFETELCDRSGHPVPVSVSASVIEGRGGAQAGAVYFVRDLTERRRMEAQVRQADRLATVGRAAAYITHEIKNPLMVIGGLARQVAAQPAPGDKEREKLGIIVGEIKRLEAILLEISEYTRMSSPERRPVALPQVLSEVLALMQGSFEKKGIEVEADLPEGLPTASADPLKLKQVFLNLIKNATDAMPEGGRLRLSVRSEGGHIEVRIKDSGPGIPPELMRQLFTPFFSTKPKGTGLGLTISRQIIQAHQGELKIVSEPGQGTECLVSLPAA